MNIPLFCIECNKTFEGDRDKPACDHPSVRVYPISITEKCLRDVVQFAYDNGYHELGVDLVENFRDECYERYHDAY